MAFEFEEVNSMGVNIKVVGVMRRHGFCMNDVFRNFKQIALLIGKKRVQGVIVAGMKYVSSDIEDAYSKIGMVKAAGGQFITVDEGNLGMNIVMEEK